MIELERIKIDGTQSRTALNQSVVDEYSAAMQDGVKFPPVRLYFDGADYWLADGFHRFFAAKKAGFLTIHEEIEPGTKRDAILYSVGANASHGLQRTREDKRKAVMMLLHDAEWVLWSDREIARRACVNNHLVAKVREEISQNSGSAPTVSKNTQENNDIKKRKFTTSTGKTAEHIVERATVPPEDEYTEADRLADEENERRLAFERVIEENERLKDAIAVGALPEEHRQEATETLEGLRKEVKTLTATNAALKSQLDGYINENTQLKKQIARMRKELEKNA